MTKGTIRPIKDTDSQYIPTSDLEKKLDDLVFTLQKWALIEAERWQASGKAPEDGTRDIAYRAARSYLDTVGEINRKFGTNYAQSIQKVIDHFKPTKPAKD